MYYNKYYKGGKNERSKKSNGKSDIWSATIKKRHNYKCQVCGSNHKLRSHHLNGYHLFKSLRFNLYNGICLCDK